MRQKHDRNGSREGEKIRIKKRKKANYNYSGGSVGKKDLVVETPGSHPK